MYMNPSMKLYKLNEIIMLREIVKSVVGYFWCYPDNTETMIERNPSKREIEEKYAKGVYIGEEFAISATPMLFEEDIVQLNNGEQGVVSYHENDPQRLAVYTMNNKVYPVSLFDDELRYFSKNSEIFVEKIGMVIEDQVAWTWEKYEKTDCLSIEELGLIFSAPSLMTA